MVTSERSLNPITLLILTYNEEDNIGRVLERLSWAQRIVVIDSGSTDGTLEILSRHPQVEVFRRSFDTHARQWNFGLEKICEGWVLTLDADYLITDRLQQAIVRVVDSDSPFMAGYRIPFRYCVFGRPLSGTVLPPRIALFRCEDGWYVDDGHTQNLVLSGRCGVLSEPILHDDRKPLVRWLWAQERYLRLEVAKLNATPTAQLSSSDRVRRLYVIAPFAILLICLIWKRGLLDGWRGWFYAFQRMYVELLLSLMLMEGRLKSAMNS
ncbi:MAG: glycosyltransferase family 2 protein [Synechococcaceae cyanobacterium MAG-AL1]|nr:glycosyltransferase family 2 protein [Candidatus Regnicoccus frigidus MAG-AL1]